MIGIGAGASTDGQVLVLHDLLGIHGGFQPKFVKRYADVARGDGARRDGLRRGRAHARASPGRSTRTGSRRRSCSGSEAQLPAAPARRDAPNRSLTYTRAAMAQLSQLFAPQGARVLRPLRGGRREHRPRGRPPRADAPGVARPRRARPRRARLRAGGRPHHARHHPAPQPDVRHADRPRGHLRARLRRSTTSSTTSRRSPTSSRSTGSRRRWCRRSSWPRSSTSRAGQVAGAIPRLRTLQGHPPLHGRDQPLRERGRPRRCARRSPRCSRRASTRCW